MSIKAQEALGADGNLVKNITLFAILIYELFGPYLTKQALIKAGDIVPKDSLSNKIKEYQKIKEKKHA